MHNFIQRDLQAKAFKSFEQPYITALLGPRRVGKSTLIKYYRDQHPNRIWAILNMDVMSERQRCEKGELQALIQERCLNTIGSNNKIWVMIDEAQKCPELFDQIKIMYDSFKDKTPGIKFILTGSGSLSLHRLSSESLAGRIEILYLREFCLREMASLKNNIQIPRNSILDAIIDTKNSVASFVTQDSPYKSVLEGALNTYLIWGGLPEVVLQNSEEECLTYLGNYLQTYLEKDVRAIQEITHLNIYQQLLEIVAAQTGSVRDDAKILEILSCARETLKKYRGYLLATLMYQELYPYIGSVLKRLIKSPKGYLLNNGLISFLTGVYNEESLINTGLMGHRFENWFLQELNGWLDRKIGQHHIYYWRTSGGVEVDFIVDKKPFLLPFEVTVSSHKEYRKIKHLKEFMQTEPRAEQGFYIYNGPYEYDSENHIHFVPAWCFC